MHKGSGEGGEEEAEGHERPSDDNGQAGADLVRQHARQQTCGKKGTMYDLDTRNDREGYFAEICLDFGSSLTKHYGAAKAWLPSENYNEKMSTPKINPTPLSKIDKTASNFTKIESHLDLPERLKILGCNAIHRDVSALL